MRSATTLSVLSVRRCRFPSAPIQSRRYAKRPSAPSWRISLPRPHPFCRPLMSRSVRTFREHACRIAIQGVPPMKIFLSGVGAAVVLMSLMAFGYFAHTASNVQQAGPIKLSDLPLNRSFQARVFVPGSTTMAFPSTSGIALTQLIVQGQPVGVFLDVNGARVYEGRADHFDPPIIVPPRSEEHTS